MAGAKYRPQMAPIDRMKITHRRRAMVIARASECETKRIAGLQDRIDETLRGGLRVIYVLSDARTYVTFPSKIGFKIRYVQYVCTIHVATAIHRLPNRPEISKYCRTYVQFISIR